MGFGLAVWIGWVEFIEGWRGVNFCGRSRLGLL